jgi:hypothetical protein
MEDLKKKFSEKDNKNLFILFFIINGFSTTNIFLKSRSFFKYLILEILFLQIVIKS